MCIDIVEIWFGIANGQILVIFLDGAICIQYDSDRVLSFNAFIFYLLASTWIRAKNLQI